MELIKEEMDMIKKEKLRQLDQDYEAKKVEITNKVHQKIKDESVVKVAERASVRSSYSSRASSKNASRVGSPKNRGFNFSNRQVMTSTNNSRVSSSIRIALPLASVSNRVLKKVDFS